MKQHPLSAAFPAMPDAEFRSLCADIEIHGQRHPCVVLDGMVLDGWHRYRACLETGREPSLVEFDGADPRAFVLSLNLNRRHLTASQRAAAVVACAEWRPTGVHSRSALSADLPPTAEKLAQMADVSVRTIGHAKTAQRRGKGAEVRDGKISAKAAAEPEMQGEAPPEADDRMDDIARDFEAMQRIVEADDQLAAAWAEVQLLQAKYDQLDKLCSGKCRELDEMTKEAKRWKRKAEK